MTLPNFTFPLWDFIYRFPGLVVDILYLMEAVYKFWCFLSLKTPDFWRIWDLELLLMLVALRSYCDWGSLVNKADCLYWCYFPSCCRDYSRKMYTGEMNKVLLVPFPRQLFSEIIWKCLWACTWVTYFYLACMFVLGLYLGPLDFVICWC